jgi:hypothetical protein
MSCCLVWGLILNKRPFYSAAILRFLSLLIYTLIYIYILFDIPVFQFENEGINARVRISGISKVELSLEELELVLQTLVYDCRLEEVTIDNLRKLLID